MYDIDFIAVPVDGSRASQSALAVARLIAAPDTVVAPFHVVEPWPPYMHDVLFPYAPLGEDAAEFEHELLTVAAAHVAAQLEVEREGVAAIWGYAPATVVAHVEQTPAQLTVVGTSGDGDKVPGLIGHVAERVLHSSGRPVWLARDDSSRPQKVLVAVDLTEGSSQVFEVAARLALRLEAELELLHVVPDPHAADHAQVLGNAIPNDSRKLQQQVRGRVEALFDAMLRSVEVAFANAPQLAEMMKKRRVMVGDAPHAILQHAEKIGADVVVVGARRLNAQVGLGRVASTVVRRASTHVVVVPTTAAHRMADD